MRNRRASLMLAVLSVATLTGCGITIPADPDGTLDRVTDGTLRVGVSQSDPWTVTEGTGQPQGTEVDLVEAFAAHLDADIEWTAGGESDLVQALEAGDLDLVVGGFTDATPWESKAAVTQPYAESTAPDGGTARHVMLAPLGENAFLVELEHFLLDGEAER
ncbi:transporter substrate-binding domain-containing protein [Labedella endophytica]|jgi:polar amino acid transport system substrate-binding protein|uniref:Transporter substrate-binding domain-containing protein n=1 Tax=Labedella endophytica TaxID=1523160 RepID=A0A433JUM0_9MICO|nr:transporter substrate-binding domain-containing protein [Labedella endophytica]RUR01851.1 transporter substrate-binding domain-containing protein [Labedella endophytica]